MKTFVFSDDQGLIPSIATFVRGLGDFDVYSSGTVSTSLTRYGASKAFIIQDANLTDAISDLLAAKLVSGEYKYGFIASTVNGRDIAGLVSAKANVSSMAEISS
ncbi:electron transfer flavoprotein alpha subunit, partial [mine drainage metagenome]